MPKNTPRCIYALEHGVMVPGLGERSEIFLRLAAYYRNQGYPKDKAHNALKAVARMNSALYPEAEPMDKVEIYNYSNEGVLSWYDFAKEIMKMAKLNCTINPIETHQYPTPAKRPHYSLLNKSKIKSTFNIEIPYWKDSLDRCLTQLGERK